MELHHILQEKKYFQQQQEALILMSIFIFKNSTEISKPDYNITYYQRNKGMWNRLGKEQIKYNESILRRVKEDEEKIEKTTKANIAKYLFL